MNHLITMRTTHDPVCYIYKMSFKEMVVFSLPACGLGFIGKYGIFFKESGHIKIGRREFSKIKVYHLVLKSNK